MVAVGGGREEEVVGSGSVVVDDGGRGGCIVARYREGRRVSNNGSQPPCRPTKLI